MFLLQSLRTEEHDSYLKFPLNFSPCWATACHPSSNGILGRFHTELKACVTWTYHAIKWTAVVPFVPTERRIWVFSSRLHSNGFNCMHVCCNSVLRILRSIPRYFRARQVLCHWQKWSHRHRLERLQAVFVDFQHRTGDSQNCPFLYLMPPDALRTATRTPDKPFTP